MLAVIDGFLGTMLVYAALAKATAFADFAATLRPVWPFRGHEKFPAAFLIVSELAVATGLLLMGGTLMRAAGVALLASFTTFSLLVWGLRLQLVCRCFGATSERIDARTVLRNLSLTVLLMASLAYGPQQYQPYWTLLGAGVFGALLASIALVTLLIPTSDSGARWIRS